MPQTLMGSRIAPVFHNDNTYMCPITQAGRREGSAQESFAEITFRRPVTYKKVYLHIRANDFNGDVIFTLRKGGVASALTRTIGASAVGEFELASDVSFASGDRASLEIDTAAPTAGTTFEGTILWVVEGTGETIVFLMTPGGPMPAATTRYQGVTQFSDGTGVEADNQDIIPVDGVIEDAQTWLEANTADFTVTYTLRVNGVATGMVLTIDPAETGLVEEDTPASIAVSAGDKVCWEKVSGAGSGSFESSRISVAFKANNPGQFPIFGADNIIAQIYEPGTGITEYWPLFNSYREASTPANEAAARHNMLLPLKLEALHVSVPVNGITSTPSLVSTLRKNGVDTNFALSWGNAEADWKSEDGVDPAFYDPGDEASLEFATGAAGTTLEVHRHSIAAQLIPAHPTGITEDAKTDDTVTTSWTDQSGGALPHDLFFAPTGDDPIPAGQVAAGDTDFQFVDLDPATTYDFWVAAYDAALDQNSQLLGPLTVTTEAAPPTAAAISAGGDTTHLQADVQIDSFDGAATEHDLFRGTTSIAGDAENLGTLVANNVDVSGGAPVEVLDTTVAGGTTYFYVLVSRNAAAAIESNEISITTLDGPNITLNKIILVFNVNDGDPNPPDQGFTIENDGDVTLEWTATESAAWLSLAPTSGTLAPSASEPVTVSVDYTGLAEGLYEVEIVVSGVDTPNSPQIIDAELNVLAALVTGFVLSFSAAALLVEALSVEELEVAA